MFDLKKNLAMIVSTFAFLALAYAPAFSFDAAKVAKRFNEIGLEISQEAATPEAVEKAASLSLGSKEWAVTKADIELICSMPNMKRVSFDGAYFIRPDWIVNLASCQNLEEVSLNNLWVDPEAAAVLGKLPKLKRVSLYASRGISDAGFSELAKSASIESLRLNYSHVSDAAIAAIAGMGQLRKLELQRARGFSSKGIEVLARKENLNHLDLSYTPINDDALKALENHPSLKYLVLTGIDTMTDTGVGYLGSLPELSTLVLDDAVLTGAFFEQLAAAPKLTEVRLKRSTVDDDGIVGLDKMKVLTDLDLESTAVGDKTAAVVAKILTLSNAQFSATQLTDAGVHFLLTLPQLDQLAISQLAVTDAAFAGKVSLTLKTVNAVNTGLTDIIAGELAKTYPALTYLNVSDALVTDDGIKDALASRPEEFKKLRISK